MALVTILGERGPFSVGFPSQPTRSPSAALLPMHWTLALSRGHRHNWPSPARQHPRQLCHDIPSPRGCRRLGLSPVSTAKTAPANPPSVSVSTPHPFTQAVEELTRPRDCDQPYVQHESDSGHHTAQLRGLRKNLRRSQGDELNPAFLVSHNKRFEFTTGADTTSVPRNQSPELQSVDPCYPTGIADAYELSRHHSDTLIQPTVEGGAAPEIVS